MRTAAGQDATLCSAGPSLTLPVLASSAQLQRLEDDSLETGALLN